MIPRFSPNYDWEDIKQVFRPCQESAVEALEHEFRRYTGHSHAIAFRYGRSGLYYLLKALGHKDKKVIIPSYSCVVVAHAVKLSGNEPVFLDNAVDRFQPLPGDYLNAIKKDPENTAMIIPTNLFGIAEETRALYGAVKELYPHVFVLQDCAHSYFCEDKSEKVVTEYGDGAIFGMNISKLVNSVKGGMLTLNDMVLAERVRKQHNRRHEEDKKSTLKSRLYVLAAAAAFTPWGYELVYWLQKNTRLLSAETDYYQDDKIELPSDFEGAMQPFEASIGLASLAKYGRRIEKRRDLAKKYADILRPAKDKGQIHFSEPKKGDTWSHFPVLIFDDMQRERLIELFEKKLRMEIGRIVDYSIADMKAYQDLGHDSCPRAALAAKQVINLPLTLYEDVSCSPAMYEKCVEKLMMALKQFLN